MKETFYKGAQGNLSLHVVSVTLAALAASATKVITERLPIGTEVVGVRHVHAALGANTAIKVELVDQGDVKTVLLPSTTTTSAGDGVKPLKPVRIADNGPSDLVLTNSGTANASGEVTIQLEYRFKGY